MSGESSTDASIGGISAAVTSSVVAESRKAADASGDIEIRLEQYKLAVEMAARISNKRQDANNFYIGLVSSFGGLYAWLDKLTPSSPQSAWRNFLPILAVCWCILWWFTVRSYRRINIVKWQAIYELEASLPGHPFTREKEELQKLTSRKKHAKEGEGDHRGSFSLTKLELFIPLLVGIIFFLLAVLPLLDLVRKSLG